MFLNHLVLEGIMKKKVLDGLVLIAVLLAALIAGWILFEESVGRADTPPPTPTPSSSYLYDEPVVPWETTPSPSPSEEPTPSPSSYPWETTPSPTPTPTPTPTPAPTPNYDLDDFCDRAKRILESAFKPKRKSVYTRCTGSYDRDTGEFSGTLEFTFMFPN